MARQDIQLIDDEPVIKDGDFAIFFSDQQHIEDTISAAPGWWKQFPDDGVGIKSWQGGPINAQAMAKSIRLNLEVDGYKVNNPIIKSDPTGLLIINPNATI